MQKMNFATAKIKSSQSFSREIEALQLTSPFFILRFKLHPSQKIWSRFLNISYHLMFFILRYL